MKYKLECLLQHSVEALKVQGILDRESVVQISLERTRDSSHGDFATNIALLLAKSANLNPRQLAEKFLAVFPEDSLITKVEIAGPGFINFFINPDTQYQIVKQIHDLGKEFGLSHIGNGRKIQVEFVSANPTGPLHVGHGRGAAYGSAVADLLEAAGYDVEREYYVNDAGRQMDILATSIWLRYLEECGEVFTFPSNGYRGEYVRDIAVGLYKKNADQYRRTAIQVFNDIPADEPDGGDKEKHIDALIDRAKTLLGSENYNCVFQAGLEEILTWGTRSRRSRQGLEPGEWVAPGKKSALEGLYQEKEEQFCEDLRLAKLHVAGCGLAERDDAFGALERHLDLPSDSVGLEDGVRNGLPSG